MFGGGLWDLGSRVRTMLTPVSLVHRYCIYTVTPALSPSAESARWAAMVATVLPTSRMFCRTPEHSPSSCWLMPSRAARLSRSVTYLVDSNLSGPF